MNALAFTIRHDSPSFAPKMSEQETASHIAKAEGFVGPCRDYLFETTQALREEGMPDRKMERLTALVKGPISRNSQAVVSHAEGFWHLTTSFFSN